MHAHTHGDESGGAPWQLRVRGALLVRCNVLLGFELREGSKLGFKGLARECPHTHAVPHRHDGRRADGLLE